MINTPFLKHRLSYFLAFLFLSIVIFEITAYFFSYLGLIGMYFWFLALLVMIGLGFYLLVQLVKLSIQNKSYFSLLALVILIGYLLFNINKTSNISAETTQQAACALNFWSQLPDKGFHQACFLGYSSRQYLLMSLPTLILGRSLFSLNLGGSLYFVIGVITWLAGLNYFLKTKKGDLLAGLSILFLLHFHFFNHFLFYGYEQSQFPLSLSLMFWGIYLWHWAKPAQWKLFLLGINLLFLAHAYTSAIAFFGLALLLVINLFINKKANLREVLIINLGSVISFFISLSFRGDIKLTGQDNQSFALIVEEIKLLFTHLFIETQGNISYSTLLGPILLLAATFTPIILGKKKLLLLSIWIIFTLLMATLSQGYFFYPLYFRIHRSIVVLPTLLFLFTFLLHKIKLSKGLLILFFILTLVWGIKYSEQYLTTLREPEIYSFIIYLKNNVKNLDKKSELIFTQEANQHYLSLNDTLMYFLPNIEKIELKEIRPSCEEILDKDSRIIVLETDNECVEFVQEKQILPYVAHGQKLLIIY